MRHSLKAALVSLALLGQVGATELRLYPQFAEVRVPISVTGGVYRVDLLSPAYGGLLSGTLDLEGLNYTQAETSTGRSTTDWLASQEGQTVVLRENGQVQHVTLIRAADVLIRDESGVYRRVNADQLGFTVVPPLERLKQNVTQAVTFTLAKPGNGVLTYLTNKLSWSPRYTLTVSGITASLSALADLSNTSGFDFKVDAAELFAGEVVLKTQADRSVTRISYDNAFSSVESDQAFTPSVASRSPVGGLFRFSLDQPFTLPAGQTLSLPFLNAQITAFERLATLNLDNQNWRYDSFQPRLSGVMQRGYRFKADQNVPGGVLSLREDGRLAGQTVLTETAKGEPLQFTLGRDPEVRFERQVELLSTERRNQPARDIDTYKVTYRFSSSKAQVVTAEVYDRFGGRTITLTGAVLNAGGLAELRVGVPPGGSVSRSYTVIINNE